MRANIEERERERYIYIYIYIFRNTAWIQSSQFLDTDETSGTVYLVGCTGNSVSGGGLAQSPLAIELLVPFQGEGELPFEEEDPFGLENG